MNRKETIYEKVLKNYSNKQENLEIIKLERQKEVYKNIPIIEKIDQKIRETAIDASFRILKGQNVDITSELEDLEEAKTANLLANGYPEDYLEKIYECPKCKDKGFIGKEECSCFKQEITREFYKMSNLDKLLQKQNFETFDFNIFSNKIDDLEEISPLENIKIIRRASEKFIRNFDDTDELNLLFYGTTGLGKTFMVNSIAKELLDLGYTVVYQTAHNLMSVIEEYKFSKTEDILEAKKKYDYLLEADLLIIDDLGTESTNTFSTSEIFNLLNSRDILDKKVLISTNLTPADIAKTYTDRVYSRLLDKFNVYKFIGQDLRWRGY